MSEFTEVVPGELLIIDGGLLTWDDWDINPQTGKLISNKVICTAKKGDVCIFINRVPAGDNASFYHVIHQTGILMYFPSYAFMK